MKTLRIGTTGGDRVTILSNIEEVRRYVENYCMALSMKTCIGDLSLLTQNAQASLLKFIEEMETDVVCYASIDNISPVLMSRFDKIEKVDNMKIGMDDFSSFVQLRANGDSRDTNLSRDFVAKSAGHLDSFLVYRKLNKAMLTRIGVHL